MHKWWASVLFFTTAVVVLRLDALRCTAEVISAPARQESKRGQACPAELPMSPASAAPPAQRSAALGAPPADGDEAAAEELSVRGALALCGLWSKPLIGLAEGCPVKARVWRMPVEPGCEWPEMAELPRLRGTANVGIAMSGGGLRACMQDLGVVMALHDQGLLGRARYISGNSGGSWFTAALGFLPQDRSLEVFLVPGVLPASALSMEVLGDLPQGSFARVASEPVVASGGPPAWLEDQFSQGGARGYLDAFAADMAQRFLAPFGLFKPRSVISTEPGTEGHRRAVEAVGHAGVQVTPARGDMPFPILNAAIRSEVAGWLPLEFTPLYAGTPVRLRGPDGHEGGGAVEAPAKRVCGLRIFSSRLDIRQGSLRRSPRAISTWNLRDSRTRSEAFAAGCPAPDALEQGGSAVGDGEEVGVSPEHFLPLPFAMGASSNVRPLLRQRWPESDLLPEGQRKDPVMQLWSPADIRSGRGGLKQVLGESADRGGIDRSAEVCFVHIFRSVSFQDSALLTCTNNSQPSLLNSPLRAFVYYPCFKTLQVSHPWKVSAPCGDHSLCKTAPEAQELKDRTRKPRSGYTAPDARRLQDSLRSAVARCRLRTATRATTTACWPCCGDAWTAPSSRPQRDEGRVPVASRHPCRLVSTSHGTPVVGPQRGRRESGGGESKNTGDDEKPSCLASSPPLRS